MHMTSPEDEKEYHRASDAVFPRHAHDLSRYRGAGRVEHAKVSAGESRGGREKVVKEALLKLLHHLLGSRWSGETACGANQPDSRISEYQPDPINRPVVKASQTV